MKLKTKPFFTTKEANQAGISTRMLHYYATTGKIESLRWGLYRMSEAPEIASFQWSDLIYATSRHPEAIICLNTALSYYSLSDEFIDTIHLAVPHTSGKRNQEGISIHRFRNINTGKEICTIDKFPLLIFNKERTIIDAFRLLDIELAIVALRKYVQSEKPNFCLLHEYADTLRFNITPYTLPFSV